MQRLTNFLREYQDRCWHSQPDEQRFTFDTNNDRELFVNRLCEFNVVYNLYESPNHYKAKQ
jgi:hypothetical protein